MVCQYYTTIMELRTYSVLVDVEGRDHVEVSLPVVYVLDSVSVIDLLVYVPEVLGILDELVRVRVRVVVSVSMQ